MPAGYLDLLYGGGHNLLKTFGPDVDRLIEQCDQKTVQTFYREADDGYTTVVFPLHAQVDGEEVQELAQSISEPEECQNGPISPDVELWFTLLDIAFREHGVIVSELPDGAIEA